MRTIISLIGLSILLICTSCSSSKKKEKTPFEVYTTKDSTIYLATDSYRGVIFKPNYSLYPDGSKFPVTNLVHETYREGWIPSKDAIISFEKSFLNYWKEARTDSLAQANNKKAILWKRIDILERQYIGFIDSTGKKKMWINIFNVDTTDTTWESIPYSRSASGIYNYEIKYDVKKDSIYDIYRY